MPLVTAQDYIYLAFRTCGQMRAGYTLPPEMLSDGLDQWTLLFDAFNARRTMNYTMPDYIFPITGPGTGTTGNGQTFGGSGYTIGPSGADFTAPRPVAIARLNLYQTANAGPPSRIPMSMLSMEEWTAIISPVIPAINVATVAAYDPQFPNGVIWVWPQLDGNSLEIFTWGHLVPPASLSTPFAAPPGYGDLVVYQLATRLWSFCTKDIMPERRNFQWVAGQAEIIRQRVSSVNAPRPRLNNDFTGGHAGNAGVNDWNLLLNGVPY